MSTLGERLRREREKLGWSQAHVARKMGLKRSSTYANWEYGTREPDLETINKLAEVLGVSPSYLSGFKEQEVIYSSNPANNDSLIKEESIKLAEDIDSLPDHKKKIMIDMLEALKEENK
ncbi:helix-turn-helix domain-containing protein [Paenibacillus tundrae]